MKHGLTIREYKGLYTIEYLSPSLGCTLYVNQDKERVETEYKRFVGMSESELRNYLLSL